MKTPHSAIIPIAAALVAVLAMLATTPAQAQTDFGGVNKQSMREKREARLAKQRGDTEQKKEQQEAPALYPQATREKPEAQASRDNLKALQKMQEVYAAGDYAATTAAADKIVADSSSNAYDKSFAYQVAGTAAAQDGDDAKAEGYFENALASNGLDNNNHYQVMFNLAATQYGREEYDKALVTLDRYMAETKSDKPEEMNLRGALLSNLKRYDEAAAVYEKLIAEHPEEKKYLMNAVAAYQQAGQDEKAAVLLSKAQTGGGLTDASEYRALYVTYINGDKLDQAVKVIDDGIAKGIIKPSPELAKDYMVIGQKAYYADDDATAIEMYKRAAPIAVDGEAALNLAKVYAANGKVAEAKAAAKQALDKGVKDATGARKLAETGK